MPLTQTIVDTLCCTMPIKPSAPCGAGWLCILAARCSDVAFQRLTSQGFNMGGVA
jgi:hypothetical protein